jgi:hypothetical protein
MSDGPIVAIFEDTASDKREVSWSEEDVLIGEFRILYNEDFLCSSDW